MSADRLTSVVNGLTFVVYGLPAPQGSKRHVGGGRMVESSKNVAPWREAVKQAALVAQGDTHLLFDGPIRLAVDFYMPKPKKPKHARPATTPDLSKLVRSTEDALTDAGVWKDDARVTTIVAAKHYVGDVQPIPGAYITVTKLAPLS